MHDAAIYSFEKKTWVLKDGFQEPFTRLQWFDVEVECTFTCHHYRRGVLKLSYSTSHSDPKKLQKKAFGAPKKVSSPMF
jgi:hypothetical protein